MYNTRGTFSGPNYKLCFSEEKKPHQRNRKQSNGNNNFYIESSHTKSMCNHNENYI